MDTHGRSRISHCGNTRGRFSRSRSTRGTISTHAQPASTPNTLSQSRRSGRGHVHRPYDHRPPITQRIQSRSQRCTITMRTGQLIPNRSYQTRNSMDMSILQNRRASYRYCEMFSFNTDCLAEIGFYAMDCSCSTCRVKCWSCELELELYPNTDVHDYKSKHRSGCIYREEP